jgi:hypothetical protein
MQRRGNKKVWAGRAKIEVLSTLRRTLLGERLYKLVKHYFIKTLTVLSILVPT